MNKMVMSNLVHRPIRTVISVVAIAVEVTLILVIVGLSLGILNDAKRRQEAVGGPLRYLEGGPFKNANDIIIDDYLARSKLLRSGSTIEVLNRPFHVSG